MAGGKLFNTIFGLDYTVSLFITAGIVVFYTFLGGFLAVSWTDCIQGGANVLRHLGCTYYGSHVLRWPY